MEKNKTMDYNDFAKWLDRILENGLPDNSVAINFNLYEEVDDGWSIQLISTLSFDIDDDDWVCDEAFSSKEDLYFWDEKNSWDKILNEAIEIINKYLKNGKYNELLKSYVAIGTGFVDGDVEIIYKK